MKRQYLAMMIGACCLIVAGRVVAEDAPPTDQSSIDSKMQQSKNFIDKMSDGQGPWRGRLGVNASCEPATGTRRSRGRPGDHHRCPRVRARTAGSRR